MKNFQHEMSRNLYDAINMYHVALAALSNPLLLEIKKLDRIGFMVTM